IGGRTIFRFGSRCLDSRRSWFRATRRESNWNRRREPVEKGAGLIERIESWMRRMRRRISRSELSLKLLRISAETESATEPGLLMIQIDGLSRRQLERAMAHRKMPFLRTLMRRDGYGLETHYSGLPSS